MNLAEIALADNEIDPAEVSLMRKYIIKMGFLESNADAIAEYIFSAVKENMTVDQILNAINN